MEKLNFPVVKGPVPSPRWLTMDDYLKFVIFNWRYTVDRETYRALKRKRVVNVPFSMKE